MSEPQIYQYNPELGPMVLKSEYDAMKAELERTEKVYRMNREYVESAKEKLAVLEAERDQYRAWNDQSLKTAHEREERVRELEALLGEPGEGNRYRKMLIENDSLRQSLKVARECLEGIEMCLGFAPDHCGESFKFALKVIEDLRQSARDALTKLEAEK